MKRYRKTGRGLLGLIDRTKKPIGGVLAVATTRRRSAAQSNRQ